MKGIVFTEFLEMVEERFSVEIADDIIETSDAPTKGAYTTVGTYDASEIVSLVSRLSQTVAIPVKDLLQVYGEHLFSRFTALYPRFFDTPRTVFDFLPLVDNHIHEEVLKLYPDAELPRLCCAQPQPDEMTIDYSSTRGFADFAEGLIRGCVAHFGEALSVERIDNDAADGTSCRFILRRQAPA